MTDRKGFDPDRTRQAKTLEIGTLGGVPRGIRVRGELDIDSVAQLTRFIELLNPKSSPIVIDAAGIEFIDSSGLHALVKLAAEADGSAGVVVRNPSRAVRRLLDLALPGGIDGMVIEFTGAGPGAAHRFSELLRSTSVLHQDTRLSRRRAVALRTEARRERGRHELLRG
jgi:anti-anti-sigma factor